MNKSSFLHACIAIVALTASITAAANAHAKNDFEALLAEVDFGGTTTTVQDDSSKPVADQLRIAALDTDATPMPQLDAQPVPMPEPAPLVDSGAYTEMPVAPVVETSAGCGDSCHGGCSQHQTCHSCGHGHHGAFCKPYVPPQLPTSTFYQHWRSNSCNTDVWNGYRNRCHQHPDLSCKHGGACGHGCGKGCGNACGSGNCDHCNSCD